MLRSRSNTQQRAAGDAAQRWAQDRRDRRGGRLDSRGQGRRWRCGAPVAFVVGSPRGQARVYPEGNKPCQAPPGPVGVGPCVRSAGTACHRSSTCAQSPVNEFAADEQLVVESADSLCRLTKREPAGFVIGEVPELLGGACPVTGPIHVTGARPCGLIEAPAVRGAHAICVDQVSRAGWRLTQSWIWPRLRARQRTPTCWPHLRPRLRPLV